MIDNMTKEQKQEAIKKIVFEMLENDLCNINEKIDRALKSGCIDVEAWDENCNPMILPKSIIVAVYEDRARCFHPSKDSKRYKEVRKNVKNISLFI